MAVYDFSLTFETIPFEKENDKSQSLQLINPGSRDFFFLKWISQIDVIHGHITTFIRVKALVDRGE